MKLPMLENLNPLIFLYFVIISVECLEELPSSCNSSQYYDPGILSCQSCPANTSMVVSANRFFCTCEEHSVPAGVSRCRPCQATELVSSDGRACVPRRCQISANKFACRKCPQEYISVTQNLDGTPLKEVQCVKCARGYKPSNNVCVRCESCACAKHELVMRGSCVPKRFVTERPKNDQTKIHPYELLDIVKHEYFCMQNDLLACRTLADECVKSFYSSDLAGPCRLWLQKKLNTPRGLPKLTIERTHSGNSPEEIDLNSGMNSIDLSLAIFTSDGQLKIKYDPDNKFPCMLPFKIDIGKDYSIDCVKNISELEATMHETYSPLVYLDGELRALPVSMRTTSGHLVQRGSFTNSNFRRYFLIHNSLSTSANVTNTIYLRTLLIKLRIERKQTNSRSLLLYISIEAEYSSKLPLVRTITTTLRVEHEVPTAGVLRGLEIWGGVLGAFLLVYALVQWRGNLRRGGLQFSLVPRLAAATAETLYFSAWFSALHALASEAGTLGISLSPSHTEEYMVKVFVYSAVALKAVVVTWTIYSQCKCDIFFLDWAAYNPPLKEACVLDKSENWRAVTLAREWSRVQTLRRAPPGYTVIGALITLHLMQPWQDYLPQSKGYRWAVASIAWWGAYIVVITIRWGIVKIVGAPMADLPNVCTRVGHSLLVFQEEYYAHYVHGRNDDSDARSLVGPLAACRIICAPPLRAIYKQLSTPGKGGYNEKDSKMVLLSKFLATFFERALDGLSWVASERTILEKLLDVELLARESGTTSVLLYDADDASSTPSCFTLTWWGDEWTLCTFDAALFGCVFIATENTLLASLATLLAWQILKLARSWFGNKNQAQKTNIDLPKYFNW